MSDETFKNAVWKKSTISSDGECVEVAVTSSAIGVRDSKDPDGARLTFTRGEWTAFIEGVKLGEFDN